MEVNEDIVFVTGSLFEDNERIPTEKQRVNDFLYANKIVYILF